MTPLINEFVADIYRESGGNLDPADLMWFDANETIQETCDLTFEALTNPLPFQRTAFVFVTKVEPIYKVMVVLGDKTTIKIDGVVCFSWVKDPETNYTRHLQDFYYSLEDGEIKVTYFKTDGKRLNVIPPDKIDDKVRETNKTTMATIAMFLDSLNKGTQYFVPTKRANHIKRLRQGKTPMFDWRTVVIEPSKPKHEHQGGTHASPRLHDRRGHWRHIKKSDKRIWVKDCKVGDPSKGVVFHDYKMKGE
jgi:hypothetical protein